MSTGFGNQKWLFILLGFISFGIVAILSGVFADVVVKEQKSEGWTIIGIEYNGDLNSKNFIHLYDSIIQEKEEGKLKGELAVLFFSHPKDEKKGKALVGVIDKGTDKEIKKSFVNYQQGPYKEVYSEINLGELFTPNPNNVIEEIDSYILKNYETTSEKYLEYYPKNGVVIQSAILQN
ncbi:hypothetical protein [Flammeovirga sp. SubArs3]|uniref:hypothetical protein n=1 Tax=Flammeovirga sp. SubArs3 TaxID=2995316 RepID=UPI00248BABEE|nr:hypothetical protein [Flammeovirga sp. SubArs3]